MNNIFHYKSNIYTTNIGYLSQFNEKYLFGYHCPIIISIQYGKKKKYVVVNKLEKRYF